MKITKIVAIPDQEIEVEIDGQDAVNAMMEGSDDWTPEQLVRRACNNFIVVLQKLPDSAISSQTDAVRKIIADALEEQVKRFRGNTLNKSPKHPRVVAWENAHRPAPIIHETVPILVWADVDHGIYAAVKYLNSIPGIRTHASCQGTVGEGGPCPYGPQIMISCADSIIESLATYFTVGDRGVGWCYVHPRPDAPLYPQNRLVEGVKGGDMIKSLHGAKENKN